MKTESGAQVKSLRLDQNPLIGPESRKKRELEKTLNEHSTKRIHPVWSMF